MNLLLWIAVVFGALWAVVQMRERRLLRERPAPGRLLGPRGQRIHAVERHGSGPPVVFIHGNPGCSLDFVHLQGRLGGRRSFAVDRPGSGWSERELVALSPQAQARLIREALREAGIHEVVLAGFSFGALVSVAWALEFPDEVKALALLAPVGDPAAPMKMDAAQAMLAWPLWGVVASWTFAPLLFPLAAPGGWANAFSPLPVKAEVTQAVSPLVGRPACLWATAKDWGALPGAIGAIAAGYGTIRAPVEILAAADDHVVGPTHARVLAREIPGAQVKVLPGAGHQVMHTHPDEVIAAVERALARV